MLFYTIKRVTALLLIFALIPSRAFSSDFENISGYETGNTPIIDAVSSADYKSLEFFVKLSPKSINDQNIGGATALHIAARNNDIKSTKTLLNVRANLNILDLEGYSPPLRACENKNEKLFALMAKNNKINFNLKNIDPAMVEHHQAVKLLSLPRHVGDHPETGKKITASIGPYGPYLAHDGKYASLKEDDVLEVGINRAVDLIEEAKNKPKRGGRKKATKKKTTKKK